MQQFIVFKTTRAADAISQCNNWLADNPDYTAQCFEVIEGSSLEVQTLVVLYRAPAPLASPL